MTLKTLSAVVVRVIGWLVILEGIKSALYSVLLWGMRVILTGGIEPPRPGASPGYLPVVGAVVAGLIELGVGWTLIQHSEFFGRIFSKGLDERV
ncbi:MAG: hypothetical protein ABSD58_11755 [Verrucomicrobiia bacterium]|jgi:hypothetical protein